MNHDLGETVNSLADILIEEHNIRPHDMWDTDWNDGLVSRLDPHELILGYTYHYVARLDGISYGYLFVSAMQMDGNAQQQFVRFFRRYPNRDAVLCLMAACLLQAISRRVPALQVA